VVSLSTIAAAYQSFWGAGPRALRPAPLPLALLGWTLGPFSVLVLAGLLPLAWCIPLLRGRSVVPIRTVVLAIVVGASSLCWFLWARSENLNLSHGTAYSVLTPMASLLLFTVTLILIWRARRRPSLAASAFAHLTLFVWLFSYAYAWFGEGP
jgi:hypothetical protein